MSLLVDDNELKLLFDFHTETELGEGRVPVGGQLCFLCVKSSLSPRKVVFFIITPVTRIIVKGCLKRINLSFISLLRIVRSKILNERNFSLKEKL